MAFWMSTVPLISWCIDRMVRPRIAVYSCPFDTMNQETKGTVLIQNANELLNYTKGEEDLAEKFVQKLVQANVNVVVSGGSISDIVLHYLDKYKIMAVKILSKFEVRRVARAVRATVLSKLEAPTPEETGSSDDVAVEEIASEKVVIFRRDSQDCRLSTIVLRGSTTNILEDIERAIDDGVHVYRSLLRHPEFVFGAAATETVPLESLSCSLSASKARPRSSPALTSIATAASLRPSKSSLGSSPKTQESTPTNSSPK